MKRVLVTGSTGFVGGRTCDVLLAKGYKVHATVRSSQQLREGITRYPIGDITPTTEWSAALKGVDTVIHLANRAHVMRDQSRNPLEVYRAVNVEGTRNLAEQAVQNGARRFIFISSIKVNGEATRDNPFCEASLPDPQDPYGVSKWEAEQVLQQIAMRTGLEVVILRPPLMYGPGVKANFLRLMQAIDRGMPLPFGAISNNRRSLLFVGNLVDAIITCINHPNAAGQTFLVSDGDDIATTELLHRLAHVLERPSRLIPLPQFLLQLAGFLSGKRAEVERLTGSLVIDSTKIRNMLDWKPPYTLQQGLEETAHWYRESQSAKRSNA